MEEIYFGDRKQFYNILCMLKSDCSLFDLNTVMEMDALTVYHSMLLTLRKECYKANGMNDG